MPLHIMDRGPDYSGNERFAVADVFYYRGEVLVREVIPWWDVTWEMLPDIATGSDADIVEDYDAKKEGKNS